MGDCVLAGFGNGGSAPTPTTYSVTANITNGTFNGPSTATEGVDYTASINPNTGYSVPTSVTVTVGGTSITPTYSAGNITIPAASVTGDIVITATCQASTFTVGLSATNGTWAGGSSATYDTDYTATLTANQYYDLPSTIQVSIGGVVITSYTFSSGTLTIPGTSITGNISVTATCTAKKFTVTKTVSNGTISGGTEATYGTQYDATLSASSGYSLPSEITMTIGGSAYTGFTYSSSTGSISIPGTDITGAITISATCKPPYVEGSVSFDAETFKTDPTGCLTYGGSLTGKTPVSNSGTGLHKVTEEGDWGFDMTSTDIDKKGTNMFGMFYCTFTSAGVRHEKLDPYNLAQKIATWDDTNKKWTAESGASSITTENTMLMIPTLYWSGNSAGFTITQSSSSGGTAYAHTVGGKTYKWLAIGVYGAYTSGSKMMSLSGVKTTANKTRATFRTEAQANTVSGGLAMQWNYWQWMLMRFLAYLSCKSFNCQLQIGNGGNNYSSGVTGGCNALGPYAGDVSGTASSVKCLIEDFWGHKYQFVDDVLVGKNDGKIYVGQNSSPNDTGVTDKTAITWALTTGGFPATILTGDKDWGLGTDIAGDNSKGLCDYQNCGNTSTSEYSLLFVGGGSTNVSVGDAGPGYVYPRYLAIAGTNLGSRLSFVLEEE